VAAAKGFGGEVPELVDRLLSVAAVVGSEALLCCLGDPDGFSVKPVGIKVWERPVSVLVDDVFN
jgi:hypothetical protein